MTADMVTDELLRSFCWKKDDRPELQSPWTKEGCTGASDGVRMILVEGRRGYDEIALDVFRVVPEPTLVGRKVSCEGIRKALASLPQVDEMEEETSECDECHGKGEWECPRCGNANARCEECDGEGKVKSMTKPTGRKIPDPRQGLTIFGVAYQNSVVASLLTVADALSVDECQLVSEPAPSRANLFAFGDGTVRVLLMPYRLDSLAQVKEVSPVQEG